MVKSVLLMKCDSGCIWNSIASNELIWTIIINRGTRWCSRLRHCATSRKVAGSIPDGVIGIFRPHYGPGVDSASNRNEYQEYFLGGKGEQCAGMRTLQPSCLQPTIHNTYIHTYTHSHTQFFNLNNEFNWCDSQHGSPKLPVKYNIQAVYMHARQTKA